MKLAGTGNLKCLQWWAVTALFNPLVNGQTRPEADKSLICPWASGNWRDHLVGRNPPKGIGSRPEIPGYCRADDIAHNSDAPAWALTDEYCLRIDVPVLSINQSQSVARSLRGDSKTISASSSAKTDRPGVCGMSRPEAATEPAAWADIKLGVGHNTDTNALKHRSDCGSSQHAKPTNVPERTVDTACVAKGVASDLDQLITAGFAVAVAAMLSAIVLA
ncbi:hypothetical protein BX600DRAFT_435962 [Xylariales sp. PMI_506]|nr:hypothetical protein BX600DRAFT_435962 [Xylariales sp. PMI_506]